MPGFFPISIPNHPGALKKGTARNIIGALEEDLDELEQQLGRQNGTDGNGQEHGQ